MSEVRIDPKPWGTEADPDDPRLDGDARKVVKSGRYIPIEDGNGGLFLRHSNDIPGLNYPANRIMAQPALPRVNNPKRENEL